MRAEKRQGQEGNRWVNKPPMAKELADWFKENVDVDEKLEVSDYVGGVTLIASSEKSEEVTGWNEDNSPQIGEIYDLVYTPYIKVETRLKYFHDLMAAHPEWHGVIQPSAPREQNPALPAGFFTMATQTSEAKEVRFVCCSMKVTIYRAGTTEIVLDPPAGTKNVQVLTRRGFADPNALMKAETGAVGRALGMAGMLVIPGTGLATAEDLQELATQREGDPAGPEAAALPPDGGGTEAPADAEEKLREVVVECLKRMEIHPPTKAEFKAWAVERGFNQLSDVTQPALRGMARRAEKMAETAEQRANGGEDGTGDKPAAKSE